MNTLYGRPNRTGRLWEKVERRDADSRTYHSLSYHRFFENYVEYEVRDAKGKKKIVRTYCGPVYRQKLNASFYIIVRLLHLLLFGTAVGLMVCAGMQERVSDSAWYLAVAELVTILLLVYTGYILLAGYLFAPKNMTTGDYKGSSKALIRGAGGMAVCFLADAGLTLFYIALHVGLTGSADWRGAGLFAVGAAVSSAILILEKRVPYEVEQAAERAEGDSGSEILY